MSRARRSPVHLSNVHPTDRVCELCPSPIVNGQGAYVAENGKATHTACPTHLTLTALQSAAHGQGISAGIMGTGGNVVAMALTVGGVSALLSLDDGAMVGTTWTIGLDAEDRERFGELESTAPVTSDADQTIADAAAWVWHIVYGNPLADGDTPAVWPSHGARVVHRNGDTGTAVGDQRSDDPRFDDGVIVIGVIWDTDPATVETYPIDALNRPTR